jgi:CubicO group peptidase (beta-lactamase class C family)
MKPHMRGSGKHEWCSGRVGGRRVDAAAEGPPLKLGVDVDAYMACGLADATTRAPTSDSRGRGYGYQWCTYADGSFAARGIFGQGIFMDPKRRLVIASNANWAGGATDQVASQAREGFYRAVQKAVDDEAAGVLNGAAR